MTKLYKIRNTITNEYSNGGSYPSFTSRGKMWKGLGQLRNHLAMLKPYGSDKVGKFHLYEDCEIVEYELVERQTISMVEEILGCIERSKGNKT